MPLLAYFICEALESNLIDCIIVSTDDEEIASIAMCYRIDVPFLRPAELAADKSPTVLCIEHVLDTLKVGGGDDYDCAVTLQPTNPLRMADDIDNAIKLLYENGRQEWID